LLPPALPARRVGLLFDQDYDALAHARLERAGLSFDRRGFDAGGLLGKLGVPAFDFDRFADMQARTARRHGWAGVLSHHEFQGALGAALVAERCGLPGTSPESILACQHKLHARTVLQQVCPEANVAFYGIDPLAAADAADGLRFPCHIKPARGTFSILARRMENRRDVERMARFGALERWSMRRMLAPFERIVAARLPAAGSALRLIVEEALTGSQHNLDGWVDERGVHLLGVVDAHTYPGTQAFRRWRYPSTLAPALQSAALSVARRFLQAVGFTRGAFNMEFFHDPASGRIAVLEFNPRLSSQFGDLYRLVDGIDPHAIAVALALGEDVRTLPTAPPTAAVAASLVWRSFGRTRPPPAPNRRRRAALAHAFPDASLVTYPLAFSLFARDARWLDSHRYGVVNLGAPDAEALAARSASVSALLGWPDAPYATNAANAGLAGGARPRATTRQPAPAPRDRAATASPALPASPPAPPSPSAAPTPSAPAAAGMPPARTTAAFPAEPSPHA
jgi:hypothetical protein